jgi:hypothetical protein
MFDWVYLLNIYEFDTRQPQMVLSNNLIELFGIHRNFQESAKENLIFRFKGQT